MVIKQLISFLLPITVTIGVPLNIESNIHVRSTSLAIMGLLIMGMGLSGLVLTISAFLRIGKGTLAPWSPTKILVIHGLHRYVRNPMIMGVLAILIGESLAILSLPIFLWAVIFFIVNTILFITYEEPNLERKFGEDYRVYKRNVNRWIPKLKPFKI
ncbi:MAG: methyltransferase [Cyclobacteriaceae bacterium]